MLKSPLIAEKVFDEVKSKGNLNQIRNLRRKMKIMKRKRKIGNNDSTCIIRTTCRVCRDVT